MNKYTANYLGSEQLFFNYYKQTKNMILLLYLSIREIYIWNLIFYNNTIAVIINIVENYQHFNRYFVLENLYR